MQRFAIYRVHFRDFLFRNSLVFVDFWSLNQLIICLLVSLFSYKFRRINLQTISRCISEVIANVNFVQLNILLIGLGLSLKFLILNL